MLKILKIIFRKKKPVTFSFQKRFKHFRTIIIANDDAHRNMSHLGEMIASGKHFSKGNITNTFNNLLDNTTLLTKQLILLSHGKYVNLFDKLLIIEEKCRKILNPHVFCPEGWDCPDIDCELCSKVKKNQEGIPYYYRLNEVNAGFNLEIGNKMSNLGELKNKLGIPVPDGFCLTIKLFEEFMLNDNLRNKKNEIFYNVDFENINEVKVASVMAQELINSIPIPENLNNIILEAFNSSFTDSQQKVAVRSSAIGEDSINHSFAGLHHTELNVGIENLSDAVLEALQSKYSPESVVYRYYSGLRDEDMPMSVGIIKMIDAKAGGVLYTSDPMLKVKGIIIQAMYGLGLMVVEGKSKPQEFIVEHSENAEIITFKNGKQKVVNVVSTIEGVVTEQLNHDLLNKPCLEQEQIKELVNYALIIEKHYNSPQDIEWVIDKNNKIYILQTRPLKIQNFKENKRAFEFDSKCIDNNYEIINQEGDCASRGIGFGDAFIVNRLADIKTIPRNSVLIAKKNFPEFAGIMHTISAIVTEKGSTTGHLSIIAREVGIPFITNAENVTQIINHGEPLTVFADENKIYKGYVGELIEYKGSLIENTEPFRNTNLYRIFHRLTKFTFKLNLTNPNSQKFAPEYCETIHDVIRFVHEMSMKEMFEMYESNRSIKEDLYLLKFEVPINVFIIDLGKGIKNPQNSSVTKDDISSEPFIALIKGMTTPGIQWAGPLPMDVKGFMNIMVSNMTDSARNDRNIGSRSYALISNEYLNFFSRLGFHFSRLDALAADEQNGNYINFHFRGGAADITRRSRRAIAIAEVLKHYNFTVMRTQDNVIAQIRKIPKETIFELLTVLGRLMGSIRNTDVTMISDIHIKQFVEYFIEGDPAPALRFKDI